jgi:hypothetical protein
MPDTGIVNTCSKPPAMRSGCADGEKVASWRKYDRIQVGASRRLNFTERIQAMAKFQKGHSGNPAGKPKGARDKRTELRELLVPYAEALIKKAVELAKHGDTTALRLCLDRLVAPVRARDEPVILEQLDHDFTERGQAIMNAGLTGRITPTETSTLMQALAAQARVFESEELASRLEALEKKLGLRK